MIKTTEFAHPGDYHHVIAVHSLDICDSEIDDNVISFVDFKSYNTKRIIRRESLSEYMRILQEQASEDNKNVEIHDNANYSMLEVLTDDNVRMYFDIENIPKDNKEMINEIIYKIYEIMQLKNKVSSEDYEKYRQYALTFNNNSHHEGLSYHLYLPIKSHKKDIYNFIKLFNYRTDYKYVNMIDYRVYGKNRLFRTVGSRCPSKSNPFYTPRNQEDYHKLIKGELADTVIQNYNNLDLVFECNITKELDDEFHDKINKVGKHFSDEIKTKLITKDKYRKLKPKTILNKPRFNNQNFNNSSSPKQLDEFKDNLKSLSLKQLNEVKDKLENELSIKQLEEIRDKLKVMVSNNKNKTKQLIRNQDNNKITILMFIVIVVLMVANLFK